MRIVFEHTMREESLATIYRNDGVVVALPSYSRKHAVPHDLAHAVAEREFGLADGVFGSIAAGAMFKNMRVVAGHPRHDAVARSKRILAANSRAITVAEIMAGVLHHAVENGAGNTALDIAGSTTVGRAGSAAAGAARHDWGIVRAEPFPWSDAEVGAAVDTLHELARQWAALSPGEGLEFRWPDRLIEPVPAAKPSHHPSRRGPTR